METTYRCNVALNGELGSVVHKEGVSAPEIKILLHLHGLGSVTNIAMFGKENIDSTDERVRLGNIYQEERVHEVFGNFGPLPLDIKELKLDINLFEKVVDATRADATQGECIAVLRRELGFGTPLIVA